MIRYVALLRGINVGGKNLIRMPALQACFEHEGFEDVSTYIQSGNVLFSADGSARAGLAERIERMLGAEFGYDATVVLRDLRQMRSIVDRAPDGFGTDPERSRDDVVFLKPPLTAREAMRWVPTRDGVDTATAGTGVLYFSRVASRAAQSRLSRIVSTPIYRNLTIRNWNTTVKLRQLLED
ncbi:MAG: DUF1697 domain-containing protein [Planctomycetaceae bacterium]